MTSIISPSSWTRSPLAQGSSLVFSIDIDDSRQTSNRAAGQSRVLAAKEQIVSLVKPMMGSFSATLLQDVRCLREGQAYIHTAAHQKDLYLVEKLSSLGYDLCLRNALGGGLRNCFRSLRHEFLLVRDEVAGVDCVLDLHFREQFEIPNPTAAYKAVLAYVPEVFVGPVAKLTTIVQALCAEMAQSFAAQDQQLPPWRSTQSMLSKWLPPRSHDVRLCQRHSVDRIPGHGHQQDDPLGPPPAPASPCGAASPRSSLAGAEPGADKIAEMLAQGLVLEPAVELDHQQQQPVATMMNVKFGFSVGSLGGAAAGLRRRPEEQ